MVHLSAETLSELMEGDPVPGALEHLSNCPVCQGELEMLRQLRTELRELPELDPPPELWSRIEVGLPAARRLGRFKLGWPSLVALQAAAMAAVFVVGLGLGRALFQSGEAESESTLPQVAIEEPTATSLADAMAQVRLRGVEYDAALHNLERLARQEGTAVPLLAEQRLARLDMLVEASRTALAAEPADPVLNSYLFAALEERDIVLQQIRASQASGSDVLWR
jgi:hypothetical protein